MLVHNCTAFKNPTAMRTRSMIALSKRIPHKILMSGTPNPNGIMDLWSQYFILDQGQTLGTSYHRLRNKVCVPVNNGQFVKWEDRPEAESAIAELIRPVTIRHKLEEVLDMPPNHQYQLTIQLSPSLQATYDGFLKQASLEVANGEVNAVNAAAKINKLLQIAAGSVYDDDGVAHCLSLQRQELAIDLIQSRQNCVVAFNWKHQRDSMAQMLDRHGITFAIIDGETPTHERSQAVDDFQAGRCRVILAHPASAGHGLTLTRGTTTIWLSPTWDAEKFIQFNHRIYRAGQTQRTETICIAAENTLDEYAYTTLKGKISAMDLLLNSLTPGDLPNV